MTRMHHKLKHWQTIDDDSLSTHDFSSILYNNWRLLFSLLSYWYTADESNHFFFFEMWKSFFWHFCLTTANHIIFMHSQHIQWIHLLFKNSLWGIHYCSLFHSNIKLLFIIWLEWKMLWNQNFEFSFWYAVNYSARRIHYVVFYGYTINFHHIYYVPLFLYPTFYYVIWRGWSIND